MNRAQRRLGSRTLVAALVAALIGIGARNAAAQERGWHSVVELSANSLFGATSQTLTSMAATMSHAGDAFNADAAFKFRYGESEDEARTKFVSARGLAAGFSIDGAPAGRVSPFLSGDVETSLEKRIALRRSAGAGAKVVFAKTNTGQASASVGVLSERTTTLSDTAVPPVRLARWSWRVKLEQRVADRVSLTHTTVYGPVFNQLAAYTVTSATIAGFDVSKAVALTLTFTDNYDSQARARGAPTNNDGSLLLGIRGTF